jgi:hypothetical protein
MTRANSEQPVVTVKPVPDVYTVLMVVAILALSLAIGLVLHSLLSASPDGYGMTFGSIFDSSKLPEPIRPK